MTDNFTVIVSLVGNYYVSELESIFQTILAKVSFNNLLLFLIGLLFMSWCFFLATFNLLCFNYDKGRLFSIYCLLESQMPPGSGFTLFPNSSVRILLRMFL